MRSKRFAQAILVVFMVMWFLFAWTVESATPAPAPLAVIEFDADRLLDSPQPDWDRITVHTQGILNPEPEPEPEPAPRVVREKRIPSKKALSKSEMIELINRGADKYGITGSDRKWLVTAWLQITWSESRWVPTAQNKNSTAAGLAQFLAAWGSLDKRLDPQWSANRFAKAFADGGKANIRKHWRATVGNL